MINVEYLARLFNGLDIYLNIDVITVYLLNWQIWALVFAWMWHELASPILLIEQGSLCILIGLEAFMLHNIALRYVPTIVMILLWLLSFVDNFLCLHHRGTLYIPSSNNQTSNNHHPVTYYVGDENGERNGTCIGLGDFLIYNILLLLIVSPSSSITTIILLKVGCIISVQIGYIGTIMILSRLWKNRVAPGLPLPVIIFSIYFFIVNIFITSSNPCIENSIPTT